MTEMGLKHKAIHAMLANPHLAPFELIDRPCQRQDWTLIDHLMVIHKVKKSDYIEDDSQASIVSMARTLACGYISENAGSRSVVLVKDGTGAQKPAVREIRLNRPPVPHIEFCKRNLRAIEYTMMKLLADMGMKNKLFLVTGAKGDSSEDELLEGNSVDNLVSFHQKYLDYQELQDNCVVVETLDVLKPPECELSDVDRSYADGSIDRPEGVNGVFVATFADPETSPVSILRDACLQCTSTEADTLLVELANVLEGSLTVCTGDSDVVAVLTACGRKGITMRVDNKSYHEGRDMHMSTFGELLFATPENLLAKLSRSELASSEDRFRALCDITAEDEYLLQTTREQHNVFEVILDAHKEDVARYLYLGGIRGSLYRVFLSRFSELKDRHRLVVRDELRHAVDYAPSTKEPVRYIFETLCPASNESPPSGSEWDKPASAGEKRKVECLEDQVPELDLDDGADYKLVLSKEQGKVLNGLKRLSKAYMDGMVPRGSYGRFLRLNQAGRHFFVRVKPDVIRDERDRTVKLFFMALCGTDYNIVPMGLGVKRLMTGVVTNYKSFSSWCQELKGLLWDVGSPRECDYYNMGMKLASLTKIPAKTRSKYWTEVNCGLMAKTMKYVYELWSLKRPRPGPEYGFSVRDDVVHFDCDEDSLFVNTVNE